MFRREKDVPVPLKNLILKTQMAGDLYDPVSFGHETVYYPRPFLYILTPNREHPNAENAAKLARMLCLYDYAGEQFQPSGHQAGHPCADHLALSRGLLFVFDPSQDQAFAAECKGETYSVAGQAQQREQHTTLSEVTNRIRAYSRMQDGALYERPLIMVLTKSDAWSHLLRDQDHSNPWVKNPQTGQAALDMERIARRSQALHALMKEYCPSTVATAHNFAREVTYIAVSAFGERYDPDRFLVDPKTHEVSIRPRDIRPCWAVVPMLYSICKAHPGLIPRLVRRPRSG
jgi:hypothetical protein